MILNDKKIKVLHIVGGMVAGGIETLLMNVYRNIDRKKFHFDFAVQTDEECFYDKEIKELGGRVIPHPKPGKSISAYIRELKKTIETYGPYDVIHSHVLFFSGISLKIASQLGIPIRIAHSHNTHDSRKDNLLRNFYRKYMRSLIKKHATAMFGCSGEACEYLFGENCWKDQRVKFLPNAIDIEPFSDLNPEKKIVVEELELNKNQTLIGHIGRFTKQKNHLFLINIFEKFLDFKPDSHLLLIGEGDDKEYIKEYVNEKGIASNVHFLGVRDDVPSILSELDLFLLPSLYEGLGIVLVEAQMAGVPSLVSDNVPSEADLGIGLVKSLSLHTNKEYWAQQMLEMLKIKHPDWETRKSALQSNGYDVTSMVTKLSDIYSSNKK